MVVYMNRQTVIEKLLILGLEKFEVDIYLYLLEHGSRTHLQLSREADIDRSKVYRYVEKLVKKNLLEHVSDNSGKKLQAASPLNIEMLIRKKEAVLEEQKVFLPELINSLTSLPSYSKREFEVIHYRGQDGVQQMLWNHLSASTEIVAFSYQNKNDMVGKSFAEKIRFRQVEKNIKLYELENEVDQGDFWYTDVIGWDQVYSSKYIDPKILEIKQYIAVFDNIVSIINWIDNEQVGVEVHNEVFAKMQKQLFWGFWGSIDEKGIL